MRVRGVIFTLLLAMSPGGLAFAQSAKPEESKTPQVARAEVAQADSRLEGEKRFRSNCGRCHLAPPKFSPRMTGTIIRHMRVRATITDEEMRLILKYMTQ